MNEAEGLVVRALNEVFGERDAEVRAKRIAEIWAEDCHFVDPDGEHHGREALNQATSAMQAKTIGFSFSRRGPTSGHHNIARLLWSYGPAGQPDAVRGMDVAAVSGGKIQTMYTFVD